MTCVWARNQGKALKNMMKIAEKYKIIAVNTKFPGDPMGSNPDWKDESKIDEAYKFIKKNVDVTKMISLGQFFFSCLKLLML